MLSRTFSLRRSQRQRISPSPEPQPITTIKQTLTNNLSNSLKTDNKSSNQTYLTSSLNRSKMTKNNLHLPNFVDQSKVHLSTSLNNANGENNRNLTLSNNLRKTNLSTSDPDPFECNNQKALAKAEAKLEKAQRLYQSAQQSIDQNISEFLRITTIPGLIDESNPTDTKFEKRIRTLQETKNKLKKKISNYQSDINRIQSGDIPNNYSSTKDIINNKPRSENDISTPTQTEQTISSQNFDNENLQYQHNLSSNSINHNTLTVNNNNTNEVIRSSPSGSISNDIGNSQFYIDSNYDHFHDDEKLNRKNDIIVPADISAIHESDRSPSTKRLTDDSNIEFNDQLSNNSNDDRYSANNSSRRSTMASHEFQHFKTKIDSMQKIIERYETKTNEMQKQIESLLFINESQHERNERLNNDLTDLTDLHQIEISAMKTDIRKFEEKLLYNFDEYWTMMADELDKLDTRATKVEQTLTRSLEKKENSHRFISKFVNILFEVFAIILLLLSTIKNLVQSRVHAVIVLILVFMWITIHYLPENYFQSSLFKNYPNIFKRT